MEIKYINLDSSVEKHQRMQQELSRHSLTEISTRFPGVAAKEPLNRMSLSESGCLLAHLAILMSCNPTKSTVILEDDIILSKNFERKIRLFIDELESTDLDFLFLGQTVVPQDVGTHMKLIKLLKEAEKNRRHTLLNASNSYRFGAFAYVVNRKSVVKIQKILSTNEMSKNCRPIDVMMGQWFREGLFTGGIVFPYIVGIESGLDSAMYDRSNQNDHELYAQMVNIYLVGHLTDTTETWGQIMSNNPNLAALEICKSIYMRLIR